MERRQSNSTTGRQSSIISLQYSPFSHEQEVIDELVEKLQTEGIKV